MIIELAYANVNLPIAAVCALVMRRRVASWSIPVVVKAAGLPLIPLAFLGERGTFLRSGALALGAVAVSVVFAPSLWSTYIDFLRTAVEPPWWTNLSHGIALAPRLLVAIVLGLLAVRWSRLAPAAVCLGLPIVWLSTLSILVAMVAPTEAARAKTSAVSA
ncbi:MAG: hypothetical protein HY264_07975 [Chloroflexi bacterium]|nr:hypothetical protein [Chloroflexota bacterium]